LQFLQTGDDNYPASLGVTIYDIAERASVSIATVSRVLNNQARVAQKTRRRVLEVASELGYQPHASAQSLARRKSSLISAVIPMITNYFFMEVLRGLQDRLAVSEFDLLVYTARTMEEVGTQLDRALHRGRSDGAMIFSTPVDDDRIAKLRRSGQRAVFVDCSHPDFDSVSIDNELGGYLATGHLIEQGHSRIGLIMGHVGSVPAHDRYQGYCRALQDERIPVDHDIVMASTDQTRHGFSEAQGYTAMNALLDRGKPDAVFVTSDVQAVGALAAVQDRGLAVPHDVAIIGFDDLHFSRHIGLSTLRQPMYDMGRLATEMLLTRIAEPELGARHTVLAPSVVVRRSTVLEDKSSGMDDMLESVRGVARERSDA
jgi:LacI family transcriptional regulator